MTFKCVKRETHVEINNYGNVIKYHDGFRLIDASPGVVTLVNPLQVTELDLVQISDFVDENDVQIGVTYDELESYLTTTGNALMTDIAALEWLIYDVMHKDVDNPTMHDRDGGLILTRDGEPIVWKIN